MSRFTAFDPTATYANPSELSYMTGVPIALLPVGSEVSINSFSARGDYDHQMRLVGKPVTFEDSDTVTCKYRDCIQAWDYVQPETTFTTGHVPNKQLPVALRDYKLPEPKTALELAEDKRNAAEAAQKQALAKLGAAQKAFETAQDAFIEASKAYTMTAFAAYAQNETENTLIMS